MNPRRTSKASKYRKTPFTKNVIFQCKKLFEFWRFPRRSSEAQEGSQEALEELQGLKIKGSEEALGQGEAGREARD